MASMGTHFFAVSSLCLHRDAATKSRDLLGLCETICKSAALRAGICFCPFQMSQLWMVRTSAETEKPSNMCVGF